MNIFLNHKSDKLIFSKKNTTKPFYPLENSFIHPALLHKQMKKGMKKEFNIVKKIKKGTKNVFKLFFHYFYLIDTIVPKT